MPLSPDRIQQIKTVFKNARILYDKDLRTVLLTDINYQFLSRLQKFGAESYQLSGDLAALNSVDHLSDGSIPFATWLRNASEHLSDVDTEKVFSRALDELTTKVSSAAPIANPTNVPQVVTVKEAIVHRDDMVSFGFLLAGKNAGESVARLQVPRHENGQIFTGADGQPQIHQGTGWLVTSELMITNHHVINARNEGENDADTIDLQAQATKTTIDFDFDGQTQQRTAAAVASLEAFDPVLDYAILRLATRVGRPPLKLRKEKVKVNNDSYIAVNIIQHPYGGPKKVAIRNNLVYDGDFPNLRYFTDTDHGSSGSPVFNDNWQVLALHRASTFVDKIQFQGRETGWVNEGTQIAAVLEDLQLKNSALYQAIVK